MSNVLYTVGIYSNIKYKKKQIDLCQAMGTGPPEPLLLLLPQKQPRLILFVEVLVEKWALVVKRDSLAMRWRLPLGT